MHNPTHLLWLGGLTVVCAASPLRSQSFVDVSSTAGITNVSFSVGGFGSGACAADFDGDGDIDVVIPGQVGMLIRYFRNEGSMTFTDQTAQSGLGSSNISKTAIAADIDNDGDSDLLLGNWRSPLQLFINDGNAQFVEEAAARGLTSQTSVYSASFGDFDRDGWLDLYIGNRQLPTTSGEPNILYRGTGGGMFADVTTATGTGHAGMTLVAPFFDYNEDLWPDIVIANDRGTLGVPNTILRNNGDGTFSDVGAMLNANQAMDGMGVDFVDVFNDGGFDFYVSDLPIDHLFLRWDPAAGAFVDDTYTYGLSGGQLGWAVHWLDYDNDGWQDLHVVHQGAANYLFRNPGTPAAAQIAWSNQATLVDLGVSWWQTTALVADLDNDGGIDVLNRYASGPIAPPPDGCSVHHNEVLGGNWLKFVPVGSISNRSGLGARFEVVAGGVRQRQYVRNGNGYLSGSDPRPHFGLGTSAVADRVDIIWPSGQVQFLDDVAANQIVEVTEPSFVLRGPMTVGGKAYLDLHVQGDEGLPYGMFLSFATSPPTALPDGRLLPLQVDALSWYTLVPGNAHVPNSIGFVNANGRARSPVVMPNQPALAGLVVWATAVTFEPQSSWVVRTIFPEPVEIVIQ